MIKVEESDYFFDQKNYKLNETEYNRKQLNNIHSSNENKVSNLFSNYNNDNNITIYDSIEIDDKLNATCYSKDKTSIGFFKSQNSFDGGNNYDLVRKIN